MSAERQGSSEMDEIAHPLKAAHVPGFITPPGQTDTLLVIVGIFLVLLIIGAGIVYFRLHALPEQMSHKSNNKAQFVPHREQGNLLALDISANKEIRKDRQHRTE